VANKPESAGAAGARASAASTPASDEYLSPNKIGLELGVSGVAVKQWIYQRRLAATKLPNGYWRVSREDLNRFLAERDGGGSRRAMLVGKNATGVGSALEEAGWHISIARNPIDAVLRAVDSKPSLAVIDIASLGEGGWAAAKKLRETRGTIRIPILLLISADSDADPQIMERSVALGAQGCLSLPITPSGLLDAAQELLGA
jgi:CheY-like chemotaxis protein